MSNQDLRPLDRPLGVAPFLATARCGERLDTGRVLLASSTSSFARDKGTPTIRAISSIEGTSVVILTAWLILASQKLVYIEDDLLSEIFADVWAMSPDGPGLLRCWIESIRDPFTRLREMGLTFFSIQECRDRFVKGRNPGERLRLEDWTRCDFILVPENGCFHLGGRGSKELVHEFDPDCPDAVEAVHRMYRVEVEVGIFTSAIAAVLGAGGEDRLNWCDVCFRLEDEGSRIGYRYLERVTGLTRAEIDEILRGEADSMIGLA